MGTIRIEEYASIGGQGAVDGSPVANLSGLIRTTVDATTSGTAETLTLHQDTRFIVVTAAEIHRISVKDATAATQYAVIPVDPAQMAFAINKSDRTLAYRTDA
jgi:hypothetical protein